ncbi:hypothetical protein GJ496_006030 [Pomphorhynchus laevis]|nr:hypothetical protein GJ496_006030 [Pomphorhynchus laevis]
MKLFTELQFCIKSSELIRNDCVEKCHVEHLRSELLNVQSMLSSIDVEDWRSHTNRYDQCSEAIRLIATQIKVDLPTRAWLKMYEFLVVFTKLTEPNPLRSLHLCEAPGAFVCALNHFIASEKDTKYDWKWKATTLNPRYEWNDPKCTVYGDCRLLNSRPDNWSFGVDDSGDILNTSNRNSLIGEFGSSFNLITADGGIDCQDNPEMQEELTSPLIAAEIEVTLKCLMVGGSFILKTFSLFTREMLECVSTLLMHFEEVYLVKPTASKSGNSERYYICINRLEERLPCLDDIVIYRLHSANRVLDQMQVNYISNNIKRFHSSEIVEQPGWSAFTRVFAREFIDFLQIRSINKRCLLIKPQFCQAIEESKSNLLHGSLIDRRHCSELNRVNILINELFDLCWPDGMVKIEFNLYCPNDIAPIEIKTGKKPSAADRITLSAFLSQPVLNIVNELLTHDQIGCSLHENQFPNYCHNLLDRKTVDRLCIMLYSLKHVTVSLACKRGCLKLQQHSSCEPDKVQYPENSLQLLRYPLEKQFTDQIKKINALWAWSIVNFYYDKW